jgi:hypothetical protein
MSRLFHTECGRVLLGSNEELTRWRWARKLLSVPPAAAAAPAELWLMLGAYGGSQAPLTVRVNGRKVGALQSPERSLPIGQWAWHRLPLRTGALVGGSNSIILTADSAAMDAWVLGVENGHVRPRSFLSVDRGRTWQHDHMGTSGVLRGEYVVRLRSLSAALRENRPAPILYEDARHPRVRELAKLCPAAIGRIRDPWRQLLALRSWVARLWEYCSWGQSYAPWDPQTILSWARRGGGHGRLGPITMCVHYAVVFASMATALGHRTRLVAITPDVNLPWGHFVAEVCDRRLGRWVVHDPNFDMHYEDPTPLSAVDVADRAMRGTDCTGMVRRGKGFPVSSQVLKPYYDNWFAPGRSYRLTGVWTRNDFISHPQAAPPNHGSTVFCETDFIWYAPDQAAMDATAMFPWRRWDKAWFA